MDIQKNKLAINLLLIITGTITSLSGIAIQIGFHIKSHDNTDRAYRTVLGLGYVDWCTIHKIVIVIFTLLCIYHVYVHRKWYKVVLAKRLLRRKNRQTLIFSVVFLMSVVTGVISWIIGSFGVFQSLRIQFIEIHDKISLFLVIFILLHVVRRAKNSDLRCFNLIL